MNLLIGPIDALLFIVTSYDGYHTDIQYHTDECIIHEISWISFDYDICVFNKGVLSNLARLSSE